MTYNNFLFQSSTSVPPHHADLIKFVRTWLDIMCVDVPRESLKKKIATPVKVTVQSDYWKDSFIVHCPTSEY